MDSTDRKHSAPGEPRAVVPAERVRDLLKEHGRTYAEEAGIRLAGLPSGREELANLLSASGQPSRLAAALIRVSLGHRSPPRKKKES